MPETIRLHLDATAVRGLAEHLRTAPVHAKKAVVTMRVAAPGEHLATVTVDGLETERILTGGECIVRNPGGEEYAMDPTTFHARYAAQPDGTFRATGTIRALPNPYQRPILLMAPWGETQDGADDCMIASTTDNPDEVYVIGLPEFRQTYQPR